MSSSNDLFETAYQKLVQAAFNDAENAGGEQSLGLQVALESWEEDPSMIGQMAGSVGLAVLAEMPLESWQKLWLVDLMFCLTNNKKAALAVSGKIGRGAPKNGAKALLIAMKVLDEIVSNPSVTKVHQAWAIVAQQRHVSIDTARDYWMERKVDACCSRAAELGLDGPEELSIEAAIDAILSRKN